MWLVVANLHFFPSQAVFFSVNAYVFCLVERWIFFSQCLLLLLFYWRIGKIYCCWSAPMTLIHTAFDVSSDTLCAKYDDNNSATSRLKHHWNEPQQQQNCIESMQRLSFTGSFTVLLWIRSCRCSIQCVCVFFFLLYFSLIPNDTI